MPKKNRIFHWPFWPPAADIAEIVAIQPMTQHTGQIFYMDLVCGDKSKFNPLKAIRVHIQKN